MPGGPIRQTAPYLPKIRFNIILPPTPVYHVIASTAVLRLKVCVRCRLSSSYLSFITSTFFFNTLYYDHPQCVKFNISITATIHQHLNHFKSYPQGINFVVLCTIYVGP